MRRGLWLPLVLVSTGTAAAPRVAHYLVDEAPGALVQAAVRAVPRDMRLTGFLVQRQDLDGDGRDEWLVRALLIDPAGRRPVNRPFFVFTLSAGIPRLLASLGAYAVVTSAAPRELWAQSVDGPRRRCQRLRLGDGTIEPRGACPVP